MKKKMFRKSKGVDGVVVAVGLALIAVIVIVAFKTSVLDNAKAMITNVGTQMTTIAGWK